jgi:hypothetical protein
MNKSKRNIYIITLKKIDGELFEPKSVVPKNMFCASKRRQKTSCVCENEDARQMRHLQEQVCKDTMM